MRESTADSWIEILQSMIKYWEAFLQAPSPHRVRRVDITPDLVSSDSVKQLARAKLTSKAHDPLFGQFVPNLIKYALLISCIIQFLHILGLTGIAGGLLAGAGICDLIFGFAFKDIIENFLAGINYPAIRSYLLLYQV